MAIGSKLGRKCINWKRTPLLEWKTLAVVVADHEPIPQTKIETIDRRVTELFPAVTQLACGHTYTRQDMLAAVAAQQRVYTLNRLLGRIDSSRRWDENLAYEAVQAAYVEVTRSQKPVALPLSNGMFTKQQVNEAVRRQANICIYCKRPFEQYGAQPVGDHYIPRVLGGLTVDWNCVAACFSCNTSKGGMLPHEFIRILAYRDAFGRKGLVHETP